MDIMQSEWPVGRFSSLKAMKPMLERHPSVVGFPDQKWVYLVPCSWRLPSPGKQTLLRAAMLTYNLDNSYAIRADRRLGWLLWAASSMVLTFQYATQYFCILGGRCIPSLFSCFGTTWKDAHWPQQANWGMRDELWLGHLFYVPSPCGASSAVPDKGYWVMLLSQVNIRQPISWSACMQGWDCGFQWHLSPAVSPLSYHYSDWWCRFSLHNEVFRWSAVCAVLPPPFFDWALE